MDKLGRILFRMPEKNKLQLINKIKVDLKSLFRISKLTYINMKIKKQLIVIVR